MTDPDAHSPPEAVSDRWQELLDDADATAEEYREGDWEVLQIRPGDVTPRPGEPFGLDVLAPGDEYDRLEETVDRVSFDTSHVYRAEEDEVRFYIVVVEASEAGVAVIVPAFLPLEDEAALAERAGEDGAMYTHVRPLSDDTRVTFTHEDPGLFF